MCHMSDLGESHSYLWKYSTWRIPVKKLLVFQILFFVATLCSNDSYLHFCNWIVFWYVSIYTKAGSSTFIWVFDTYNVTVYSAAFGTFKRD